MDNHKDLIWENGSYTNLIGVLPDAGRQYNGLIFTMLSFPLQADLFAVILRL